MLPFGLFSAPWLFTTVMSHSIRLIRYAGGGVISFLDDCIFGGSDPHGTVTAAQRMLAILRNFGWLIHPTKCVGTSSAVQTFVALGTLVDLVTHTYVVPPATVDRILSGLSALVSGFGTPSGWGSTARPHQGSRRFDAGGHRRGHARAHPKDGSGHLLPSI